MYPIKKDCQNYTLICLKDVANDNTIRSYFTEHPCEILQLYQYMYNNEIDVDVDIDYDDLNEKDKYNDTIGTIQDITVCFGSKSVYPRIDIWVEVRNYR